MRLIIKHLGKIIKDVQLEEGQEYFGGRQKDCDLVLEDETLSRKHIKIYQSSESGNWIIESISEKKGLYSEGASIDSLELEDSAVVSLNNYSFEFSKDQKESENLPVTEETKTESPNLTNGQETFNGSTKILNSKDLVYSLHISIEGESSDHVPLNEGNSWILGRSENCDIYIDYNILSREHLKFLKTDNTFTVTDLGSSNGTFLNDKEMVAHKPYHLNANDLISSGDLDITFEIRNKDFENIMSNLPAINSEENNSPSVMAFPKIVLEESSEEETSQKEKFLNKKRIILFSGVGILLISLFLFSKKEDKKVSEKDAKKIEDSNLIKESYNLAIQFLQQEKFQFCIDELKKLHNLTERYLDSKQILTQCENSSENQKRYEEFLANEKKKKETEQKVKKLTEECQKQADTFQTVDDLYACAKPILELDPSNAAINSIKLKIEEKATLSQLEEDKKQKYTQMIQSKRYLYNKARKIDKKNKPLKAIAAYKVFIKSAKGVASLASLSKKAKKEMNEIQKNYDTTLKTLYSNCEKFIQEEKMKEAYYECKAILKFRKNDPKAPEYMKIAENAIRSKLKGIYAKSVFEENLANTEEAKKLWKRILKEDIKDGHYYKKAKIFLDRYK